VFKASVGIWKKDHSAGPGYNNNNNNNNKELNMMWTGLNWLRT
jgi:hypothetical protein